MRLYDFVFRQVSFALAPVLIVCTATSARAQLPAPPVLLDLADIGTTVSEIAAVIAREYMDASVGAELAAYLARMNGEGRYGPQTAEQLAARLTRELLERSGDKHLAVSVVRDSAPSIAVTSRQEQVRRSNGGVQRVEVLPGNIGYRCGRDERRPVFVLTSRRTFSAGEGFAFLLQERGRATVVGERTAGAANPGRPYRINERFDVTVPNGRTPSAVRGTNWDGSKLIRMLRAPTTSGRRGARFSGPGAHEG